MDAPPGRVLIVGCGQEHRRDDQAGLRVAERLQRDPPAGAAVRLCSAPGRDLLDQLDQADLLVLVDAARAGSRTPGEWARIDYRRNLDQLPPRAAPDTHVMNVESVLRLGETLGILPAEVWVYAIAIADAGFGQQISPSVAGAISDVCGVIRADLAARTAELPACTSSP